ncbi:uncharacterized protein [Dysidea avara]|uniref:uncharacterized protein n=1 Tax=Dysidea avara TaxID=196820 RepID=UPI00332E1C01
MLRGKSTPLSNNEGQFIQESITERIRLDKRDAYDYRDIDICIDNDNPGMVEARIGNTRVLTRVACDVVAPKSYRPREGVLFFQVELTPLASPSFDVGGRNSQVGVEVCRLLERTIRDSRAVDLESLCIVTGEKVWEIRVYVNVLDHCGNLIDCASIATITALKHFKRPDVSISGQEITIHPVTERVPIPLSVYHLPLCVTFAFFSDGDYLLVDPTDKEEQVMDGRLIVGVNEHKEICALHLAGGVAILPEQIIRCFEIAASKCKSHTAIIQEALLKQAGSLSSPLGGIQTGVIETTGSMTNHNGDIMDHATESKQQNELSEAQEVVQEGIRKLDAHTAVLDVQDINPWEPPSNSDSEDLMIVDSAPPDNKITPSTIDSGSEEDDVVILNPDDMSKPISRQQEENQPHTVPKEGTSRKRQRKKKGKNKY